MPGGSHRNFDAYGQHLPAMSDATRALLCDPQTSGGLLIAAAPPAIPAVQSILQDRGLPHQVIGALQASPHSGPVIHFESA